MTDLIRLHLGCGRSRFDDWLNVDLYPAPNVDRAFDVEKAWPLGDNTVEAIYASHLLEHLHDPFTFFQEAHRVLIPNGSMCLRTPFGGHRMAWADWHHQRPWYPEAFAFLQPGYAEFVGNPQSDDWHAYFGIEVINVRVSAKVAALLRRWWWRKLLIPWLDFMADAAEELFVYLYALKTAEAQRVYLEGWRAGNPLGMAAPLVVPCQYVAYRSHLRGARADDGDPLIPLAEFVGTRGFHRGGFLRRRRMPWQ